MADRYEEKAWEIRERYFLLISLGALTKREGALREACALAEQAIAAALREQDAWWPIDDPEHPAPRDGTKVDLLYPHPRGRQVDCYWTWCNIDQRPMWGRREPRWEKGELVPESRWFLSFFPNMEPTHWRPAPAPPPDTGRGQIPSHETGGSER